MLRASLVFAAVASAAAFAPGAAPGLQLRSSAPAISRAGWSRSSRTGRCWCNFRWMLRRVGSEIRVRGRACGRYLGEMAAQSLPVHHCGELLFAPLMPHIGFGLEAVLQARG
jgi:hypothetical protein